MVTRRVARVIVELEPGADVPDEMPHDDRLVTALNAMLGRDWRLEEWYPVTVAADADGSAMYGLEFCFVPDGRTDDERLQEVANRASAALNEVLSRPGWSDVLRS